MKFLRSAFALIVGLVVVVAAVPAILALFGFAIPFFDLFNHLQFLLFFETLAALIAALLVFGLRGLITPLAALGFASSAVAFVPVWVEGMAPRPPPGEAQTVKLLTHNLFGQNYDMQRVASVVAKENPDIIALQEFFPEQFRDLDPLLKRDYPYSVHCQGGRRANIGLYSRIPFDKEMTDADCPDNDKGQRTAHILARFRLVDGSRFTVMTTHMDWPYPIERQRQQFADAVAAVKQTDGPLILVGDFNSTPWSYALRNFSAEAGLTRETQGQPTFPDVIPTGHRRNSVIMLTTLPFLPLDQVFDRGITVHELHVASATGSDHLPVAVTFSVAPPSP
jgi:endonuclease/exonuclease/phosphatase (EEP) superfamily protein YafD